MHAPLEDRRRDYKENVMCGCTSAHPGVSCGGDGCRCHRTFEQSVKEMVAGPKDEEIYLSVSFNRVSRAKANEILKMVLAVAGLTSYSVYINEDPDDEIEE